jgi:transposase
MLSPGPATRIYLAAGVTDMRKSFDGLFALTRSRLERDPLEGHLYLFCNRRRDRLKILCWDGSGLWVMAKRLEKGTFGWPQSDQAGIELTPSQLHLLLGGMDLRQTKARRWLGCKKSTESE